MNRLIALLVAFSACPALAQVSPCYWSGQLTKCSPTTGFYLWNRQAVRFGDGTTTKDSTTNYVELKAPASVTTYSLTWPGAQGAASTVLTNNGSGVLSWAAGGGTVTSISGTPPIIVTSPTTTPVISITQAATAADGYLSSTDWNTFNGKQAGGNYITALTGDVTASGPGSAAATLATVTVGKGGTGLTSGTSGGVLAYTASGTLASSGELTSHAVVVGGGAGVVPTVVTNNSTATNKFLTQSSSGTPAWATVAIGDIPGPAATSTNGYLSSTDWTTFNAKVGTARSISTTAPLSGGGDLSADRTLSIPVAATAANGYLSSTDWNAFSAKVATTRAINTTAPITGGGDLSADRTLALSAATTSGAGSVSNESVVAEGAINGTCTSGITIDVGTWTTIDSCKYKCGQVGSLKFLQVRLESTTISSASFQELHFTLPVACPAWTGFATTGNAEWDSAGPAMASSSVGGTPVAGSTLIFDSSGTAVVYAFIYTVQAERIVIMSVEYH